jgi:hypothetical protein
MTTRLASPPASPVRTAPGPPPASRAHPVLVVPAAALAASAGLSFSGALPLPEIAATCVVSAAIPALIASIRRGAVVLVATVLAWAALLPPIAVALAAPGTGSGASPWHLLAGLANTPRQLLTTVPPAPASPPFLLALGTLVWFAAAWTAGSALRPSGPLLPLTVPFLVLLAGTAAGVPAGSATQLWPAALFVAVTVILLASRSALGRTAAGGQGPGLATRTIRLVLSAATMAVVTGLAVGIAAVLPGLAFRPPADPRPLVVPPPASDTLLDPLSLASSWLAGSARPLFTVTTSNPVNLRWLVLDRYDGIGWSSSASYLPAGSAVPAATGVTVPTQQVSASVQITGLPGMWLPAADRPARVTGVAVRVDPASGTLATYEGSAAAGASYQVISGIAAPRLADLVAAVPGSGRGLAAQRSVPPGLPRVVADYGRQAVAGAVSPYQEMVLLQDSMLRDLHYSPQSAPGESYGHLAYFVTGKRVGGPGVFATLFAVLARADGFPSRVVIGFTPGHSTGPGQYQVTTADTLVWPEVYFAHLGWVPFYPLPRPGSASSQQFVRPLGEPSARSAMDQQAARAATAKGARPGRPAQVTVPSSATGSPAVTAVQVTLIVVGALAVVACGYLIAAAVSRAMTRRHRRRHPDPRLRVAGAWRDALGGIRIAGSTDVWQLTALEVTQEAQALLGPASAQPLGRLATLANAALFAPASPTDADADAAWADAVAVRRLGWRHAHWRSRAGTLLLPVRR